MYDTGHRLRVQRFVYLLQAFDIYLGYDYSWYMRGPYCTRLAAVGCALEPLYGMIPCDKDMVFADPGVQDRFEHFKRFIRGRENDGDFLEAAASLHVLHRTSGMPRADIVRKVAAERDRFGEEYCNGVWDEMAGKWRLVE